MFFIYDFEYQACNVIYQQGPSNLKISIVEQIVAKNLREQILVLSYFIAI